MRALTSSRVLVPSVAVQPVKFTFINFATCLDDDLDFAGPAERSHSEPRPSSSVTSLDAESTGRRLKLAPAGGNITAESPVRASLAEAYKQLQQLQRDSKDDVLNVANADSGARGIAESSPQTRVPDSSGTQGNMHFDRSEDDLDWMAIQDLPRSSWSVGSSKHADGKCKPCAWNWKPNGCVKAESCEFCHMCEEGMVKLKQKKTLAAHRAKERSQRTGPPRGTAKAQRMHGRRINAAGLEFAPPRRVGIQHTTIVC